MTRLQVTPLWSGDDVVDQDLILLWGDRRKIITGADILGRLLRGIAGQHDMADPTQESHQAV